MFFITLYRNFIKKKYSSIVLIIQIALTMITVSVIIDFFIMSHDFATVLTPGERFTVGIGEKIAIAQDIEYIKYDYSLTGKDVLDMKNSNSNILAISPLTTIPVAVLDYQHEQYITNSPVKGVNEQYINIQNIRIRDGNFFHKKDIENVHPVTVISNQLADMLFNEMNPIGEKIMLYRGSKVVGTPLTLTVIGVFEINSKLKNYASMEHILIPYPLVRFNPGRINIFDIKYEKLIISCTPGFENSVKSDLLVYLRERTEDESKIFFEKSSSSISEIVLISISDFTKYLSALSIIIILINFISLLSFLMMRISDNMRRYGIEISVGSTIKRIRLNIMMEIFLLMFIGIFIGGFFSIFINGAVIDVFLKSTGLHMFLQIEYHYSILSGLESALILFGMGLIVSLCVTRQIKKISPSMIMRY